MDFPPTNYDNHIGQVESLYPVQMGNIQKSNQSTRLLMRGMQGTTIVFEMSRLVRICLKNQFICLPLCCPIAFRRNRYLGFAPRDNLLQNSLPARTGFPNAYCYFYYLQSLLASVEF